MPHAAAQRDARSLCTAMSHTNAANYYLPQPQHLPPQSQQQRESDDHVVYVLECEGGKYYVGRCKALRLRTRFLEHQSGEGLGAGALRVGWGPWTVDRLAADFEIRVCSRISS
mgnify:CR=1 FL=1